MNPSFMSGELQINVLKSRQALRFLQGADQCQVHSFRPKECAGYGANFRHHRLPWFPRVSPSTTLNEIRYINECGYIDGFSNYVKRILTADAKVLL